MFFCLFFDGEGVDFAPKGGHNSISGDPELLFLRLDVDKIDEALVPGFPAKWTNF